MAAVFSNHPTCLVVPNIGVRRQVRLCPLLSWRSRFVHVIIISSYCAYSPTLCRHAASSPSTRGRSGAKGICTIFKVQIESETEKIVREFGKVLTLMGQ